MCAGERGRCERDYREKGKLTAKPGSKTDPSESQGGLPFDLSANANENNGMPDILKKEGNPNRRGKKKR